MPDKPIDIEAIRKLCKGGMKMLVKKAEILALCDELELERTASEVMKVALAGLQAEIGRHDEEIGEWKEATMLSKGGDSAGITPDDLSTARNDDENLRDKLPKDHDGKLIQIYGDHFIVCSKTGIRACTVIGIRFNHEGPGVVVDINVGASPPYMQGQRSGLPPTQLYSTREAAEAAKGIN